MRHVTGYEGGDDLTRNSSIASQPDRYNRMRVGAKTLDGEISVIYPDVEGHARRRKQDRGDVVKVITQGSDKEIRALSDLFFRKSGIYSRLCRYMANLYRYDTFVTPMVYDDKLYKSKGDKIVEGWYKSCRYIERSDIKRTLGLIALDVIRYGNYYAYTLPRADGFSLQELPRDYCRSRYSVNGVAAVEMNMKFFDDAFKDQQYRLRVIKMFPAEIQRGYVAYKAGKLPKDFQSDDAGWLLLDTARTVKFNIGGSDMPLFASVIPHLMDLEDAQELDKKKMMQQIMKIIIQHFPMNKAGTDPTFTIDEMNAFHMNAVQMLGDAVGVDVLSTLADVSVEDMSDSGNMSAADQLEKVERSVYNEAGVASAMFNTSGNLALEKSVTNDEATMSDLLFQFQEFIQRMLAPFNRNRKLYYSVQMLPTTGYNYKDLSKLYREHTTLGFSKLLPQVALGHPQSSIVATAMFENRVMKLSDVFTPPQSSNTISSSGSSSPDKSSGNGAAKQPGDIADGTTEKGGRPEKDDDEKSEKTIQNRESM